MQEITLTEIKVQNTQVIEPAFVTKESAGAYIGCPKLIERMLWGSRHTSDQWVWIVHNLEGNPREKTLIDFPSLKEAKERIRTGEAPPRIGKVPKKAPLQLVASSHASNQQITLPETNPVIEPAFVTKESAGAYIGCPKFIERMLWGSRHTSDQWIEIVQNREGNPREKTLIDFPSLKEACERIRRGEVPPRIGKAPKKKPLKLAA
jgi:hypothetical protein